jgi:hypothetical protein
MGDNADGCFEAQSVPTRKVAIPMKHQQLTDWQIVCEAQTLHPDWTVAEHVAHLRDAEGRDVDPIWVGRWLRNIAADATS